ncbi:MAG: enoyl-CoA hydratase/isomerase family protein [Pseudomonadota bacterium]
MSDSDATDIDGTETIVRREGRAGRITLNRPRALNALRYEQIGAIDDALIGWQDDADVELVIIDAIGDRAFCAGGDVRELYDARETDPDLAARFWYDEYTMNARIHRYPKPVVTCMSGIVMGGGIGLSAHASHRLVTETSSLAMPETTIGLMPDVGGSWLLAHAPGYLGRYLGLTGARMGPADAIYAGFADTHVQGERLTDLIAELVDPEGEPVGVTIAEYASAPAGATHAIRQPEIDAVFGAPTLAGIYAACAASDSEWLQRAAADLEQRSPLALGVCLEAVRRASDESSLEAVLNMEYRLATRLYDGGEMIEGVRALIIDKDRKPQWHVARLHDLTPEHIAPLFAPLQKRPELALVPPQAR